MPAYSKPDLVVFSLDYDSCGDILFIKQSPHFRSADSATSTWYQKKQQLLLQELRNKSLANATELYVGSNRQSMVVDTYNMQRNGNGSCLANYPVFCKDEGYVFVPLLLADIDNNKPVGTAINNPLLNFEFSEYKSKIILEQLKYTHSRHREKNVHFYFYDDDINNIIIPEIDSFFTANPEQKPNNIQLTLIKFFWRKDDEFTVYSVH